MTKGPIRLDVCVGYAVPRAGLPSAVSFRKWIAAALANRIREADLAVRIVGTREGRALNRHYRGKDYATNVLSFPAELDETIKLPKGVTMPLLGDLVLCAPVVAREAREQKKPLAAHYAHLTVHGTLHLLGLGPRTRQGRRVHGAAGTRDPRGTRRRRSLSRRVTSPRRTPGQPHSHRPSAGPAPTARRDGPLATRTGEPLRWPRLHPTWLKTTVPSPLNAGPGSIASARCCPANHPPARTSSSCCAMRRATG